MATCPTTHSRGTTSPCTAASATSAGRAMTARCVRAPAVTIRTLGSSRAKCNTTSLSSSNARPMEATLCSTFARSTPTPSRTTPGRLRSGRLLSRLIPSRMSLSRTRAGPSCAPSTAATWSRSPSHRSWGTFLRSAALPAPSAQTCPYRPEACRSSSPRTVRRLAPSRHSRAPWRTRFARTAASATTSLASAPAFMATARAMAT
mmetsp:Transcript_8964/g.25580  ORF Transcript_8964/g.25580 Transcript_8964/m.25580 type:complete len:204 (-) Transcript_8964:150-761(-)